MLKIKTSQYFIMMSGMLYITYWDRPGRDHMVVIFTTTYPIST